MRIYKVYINYKDYAYRKTTTCARYNYRVYF